MTPADHQCDRRVLRGSYYEIGLQLGARMGSLEIPAPDARGVSFADACERLVADLYPPILGKVQGMIEGGKLNERDFRAFFFARHLAPQVGCTNLAVLPSHTATGSLVVGVNYDWYYYAREWREMREIRPQGALSSLQATHHWAGSPDGINAAGLGVFLSVLPREEPRAPGLGWHLVTDILLDTCSNVEAACQFMTSAPFLGAFNYLITDAAGQAVVAEALPGGTRIREPEGGFIVATNHLPGREVAEHDLSSQDRRRLRRSRERYKRATQVLENLDRPIDEAAVKSLLADHEAPICRGNHDPVEGDDSFDNVFGTIWSLIARPGDRFLDVACGHPCRSEYQTHYLC